MQSSKKRLRSHASDEKAAKTRKLGRSSRSSRQDAAAAAAASTNDTDAEDQAAAAADDAAQAAEDAVQQLQRGYKAIFHWEHYPFASIDDEVAPAESDLVPSIPALFTAVLQQLRDVEHAYRARDVLGQGGLDRRILRPHDGRSKSGPVIPGVERGSQFVVTACRREHVQLIYQDQADQSVQGQLAQLGLCPHLLDVVLVDKGVETPVGGPRHDARLKCMCRDLETTWEAEEASRKEAGMPTEAERAERIRQGLGAEPAGAGDEDADEGDGDGDAAMATGDEDAGGRRSSRGGARRRRSGGSDSGSGKGGSAASVAAAAASAAAAAGAETAEDRELAAQLEEAEEEAEEAAPAGAEVVKDTALTVGEIWDQLESQVTSARKASDKAWRLRLKTAEREKDELRQALAEAEERAADLEERWKAEKDTNAKLWGRIEGINKTIDRMVRPTGGRK